MLDEDAFGFDFIGETRVELHKLRNNHLKHFSVFLETHHPVNKDYCISYTCIIIVNNINKLMCHIYTPLSPIVIGPRMVRVN